MTETFKIGDKVSYCSIIGGAITSKNHIITELGRLSDGNHVAWITKKSGCVSLQALIKEKEDLPS